MSREPGPRSGSEQEPAGTEDWLAARSLADAARRIEELELQNAALEERTAAELGRLRRQVARVEGSVTWRAFQSVRGRVYGRIGEDSRAARAISAVLRRTAGVVGGRSEPGPAEARTAADVPVPPVASVPAFDAPVASLILPVHAQPQLTADCVRSIVANTTVPYELIIVDDQARSAVKQVVSRIPGARVLVNAGNLGYARSLNRGAVEARGEFLVLLNDDIVPHPGWLEAMVACARSSSEVAVVVPKYLDPRGFLKEAGAIVWRDGSADHFGRGDPDLERSRYGFRREVDYGSGACLLVRRAVFERIGGLDEQFAPAYYEDVDLCFAVREAGSRVVYEPRAEVTHIEGATAGRNVAGGTKRFQVVNRERFVAKWAHRLAEQPERGGDQRFAAERGVRARVLVADERVPSPGRDGGSNRMWAFIRAYRGMGCAVTLLPASGDGDGDGAAAAAAAACLEAEGVEVLRRPVDARQEVEVLGPELQLAVLSRPLVAAQLTYRLREVAPAARLVYDTCDLHYVRELRRSLVQDVPAARRIDAIREIELAMVRSCDATIALTDAEREEILRSVDGADVRVIPTIAEPATDVPGPEGREGIIFVGHFPHSPNADAAVHLVRSIMPLVWREEPSLAVTLIGPDPPPAVQELAGPRVTVRGWVEDLTPEMASARVAVAPLRYGAGLKIKIVSSLAAGLPTVSSTVGAEGIAAAGDAHLLVADDADSLAGHIVALARDDGLWRATAEAGCAFVREHYSADVIIPRLRVLLPDSSAAAGGQEDGRPADVPGARGQ